MNMLKQRHNCLYIPRSSHWYLTGYQVLHRICMVPLPLKWSLVIRLVEMFNPSWKIMSVELKPMRHRQCSATMSIILLGSALSIISSRLQNQPTITFRSRPTHPRPTPGAEERICEGNTEGSQATRFREANCGLRLRALSIYTNNADGTSRIHHKLHT